MGVIMLWAGKTNEIPAGWLLCNGQSGTPDLSNLFIRAIESNSSPGPVYHNSDRHPPLVAYPIGGIYSTSTITFKWVGCNQAVAYVLQVASSGNFAAASVLVSQTLNVQDSECGDADPNLKVESGNIFTFQVTNGEFKPGNTFYWRVLCRHDCETVSPDSSNVASFTLNAGAAQTPVIYKLAYIMKAE